MTRHIPVLLQEVLRGLALRPNVNVIDATLGDAGHAEAILQHIAPSGTLLGIDADPEALLRAKHFLYDSGERVTVVRDTFLHLAQIVQDEAFGPVSGILIDLGWSSPQFEERGRGFSFQKTNEPLDMRYSGAQNDSQKSAADLLQETPEQELANIFRLYGEERLSNEIAHTIVIARQEKSIQTVGDLVELVLSVYRDKLKSKNEVPWIGGLHPATKIFQALRIAVNNELDVLKEVLPQAVHVLAPGGRLAVISFHSLEDRIVKHFFQKESGKTIQKITKKPITAEKEEREHNPRATSAKLRIIEKL